MPVKKVVAKKAPAKKAVVKSRATGDTYACEVCGLAVVVEEVGGITVSEESALLCCSKPMKQQKSKAKARVAK